MQDFWVFGYGSLMWRPGFPFRRKCRARMYGVHRALCVYSHVHRGTSARPGLVLGLDAGGSCVGTAFLVAGERADKTLSYLRAREQATMVYRETTRKVWLEDEPEPVSALCYLADRSHRQYAGRPDFDEQVRLIRQGRGASGASIDYLNQTVRHLRQLGIHDHRLEQLDRAVAAAPDR